MKNKHNRVHAKGESGKCIPTIESLLKKGKENAISTKELVRLSESASARQLQERIAEERAAGAIICSGSGKGYWLPKDRQEIEDFCRTMDKKAKSIFNATKSARQALEMPEGQQYIDEYERK